MFLFTCKPKCCLENTMLWFGVLKQKQNKKKVSFYCHRWSLPLREVSRTPMYVLIFYTNWCGWTSIHPKWGTNNRPTKKWTHPSQAWWTNELIWITCRSISNSCLISGKSIIENSFASPKSPPKPGLWLTKAISLELPCRHLSLEKTLYSKSIISARMISGRSLPELNYLSI